MKLPKRTQTSLHLFAASVKVLRRNPGLLLFPLISFTITVVVATVVFLLPAAWLVAHVTGHSPTEAAAWSSIGGQIEQWVKRPHTPLSGSLRLMSVVVLGVVYFCSIALATFFNVGFYQQIMEGLNGNPVSVSAGLRFAWSRIESILMWSLFAASVGMVLRALSERFGPVGRWVLRLVGATWTVAAVFVTPVLVRDPSNNPVELLRNSVATLKKTWGEALIGYTADSISGVVVLLLLGGINLGMLAIVTWLKSPVGYVILMPLTLLLSVAGLVAFAFLSSMAMHIYRCALYVYASEGVIPEPFTPEMMDAPWKIRR